jgi:hypothetical protein
MPYKNPSKSEKAFFEEQMPEEAMAVAAVILR